MLSLPVDLQAKAGEHLDDCDEALRRMRDGLSLIASDSLVFEAFRFANRAMLMQREKSVEALNYQKGKGRVLDADKPAWRPFQLAFILLNLRGIVTPDSADREIVDLLWFPTGGGKTEAYLGLAAFTMGLRRLHEATKKRPDTSGDGGVTVLMRYTLRLLTIQQFQRAATLLCACEVLRREAPAVSAGSRSPSGSGLEAVPRPTTSTRSRTRSMAASRAHYRLLRTSIRRTSRQRGTPSRFDPARGAAKQLPTPTTGRARSCCTFRFAARTRSVISTAQLPIS